MVCLGGLVDWVTNSWFGLRSYLIGPGMKSHIQLPPALSSLLSRESAWRFSSPTSPTHHILYFFQIKKKKKQQQKKGHPVCQERRNHCYGFSSSFTALHYATTAWKEAMAQEASSEKHLSSEKNWKSGSWEPENMEETPQMRENQRRESLILCLNPHKCWAHLQVVHVPKMSKEVQWRLWEVNYSTTSPKNQSKPWGIFMPQQTQTASQRLWKLNRPWHDHHKSKEHIMQVDCLFKQQTNILQRSFTVYKV